MGGHGSFKEPRLGIAVEAKGEDLVKPKLPALRAYQHSLAKPAPAAGSFDAAAARRGQAVFAGAGRCASCHAGTTFTDDKLHAPAETGMDPAYAERSATKKYRATPLRALWQHAPYFHDGGGEPGRSGGPLRRDLALKLSAEQKKDLVEYLKSI
jgi:mono/diheme cytochrome c family protein